MGAHGDAVATSGALASRGRGAAAGAPPARTPIPSRRCAARAQCSWASGSVGSALPTRVLLAGTRFAAAGAFSCTLSPCVAQTACRAKTWCTRPET